MARNSGGDVMRIVLDQSGQEMLLDLESEFTYLGTAPVGTKQDEPKWEIQRLEETAHGHTLTCRAGIAWTKRATARWTKAP